MKIKNLRIPAILLMGLLVAYAILTVILCYNTKPAVSEGEFPFSITYEYRGETGTTSGVIICKYEGSQTIFNEHTRYWSEETVYTEGDYVVYQDETKTLAVQPGTEAGYLMGDPLYSDYHQKHYDMEEPGAYVEYYDFDIYSKSNFYQIIESVKDILQSNEFEWVASRTSSDMYEADTGYFHRTLSFSYIRKERQDG